MARKQLPRFSPKHFFEKVGKGKTLLISLKKDILFSQGDSTEAIFYIQKGQVKLSVVSQQGKEAVVAMLGPGAFWEKGVSPDSWYAWPRRPRRKTLLSCALKSGQ